MTSTVAQTQAGHAPTTYWVSEDGSAQVVQDPDLRTLLERSDGWVWLDVPVPGAEARQLLSDVFGFHPRAVTDCLERNHVPKVHVYAHGEETHDETTLAEGHLARANHFFLVLHRPLPGEHGHVHYLELDQFIGPNFLVTLHGPASPKVPVEELLTETSDVAARIGSGRLRPRSPLALSCAIVSALTGRMETSVGELARDVGMLEQRVMAHAADDKPQDFLDEIQAARHALLTVRTMASQSSEVYARGMNVLSYLRKEDLKQLGDVRDQYHRLDRITASQLEFLHGVTDYYRARTDTKMTIAAERLAVIAAITLPVTAISSVLGMNVIVNEETRYGQLVVVLVLMGALSGWLMVWARRQGWW